MFVFITKCLKKREKTIYKGYLESIAKDLIFFGGLTLSKVPRRYLFLAYLTLSIAIGRRLPYEQFRTRREEKYRNTKRNTDRRRAETDRRTDVERRRREIV